MKAIETIQEVFISPGEVGKKIKEGLDVKGYLIVYLLFTIAFLTTYQKPIDVELALKSLLTTGIYIFANALVLFLMIKMFLNKKDLQFSHTLAVIVLIGFEANMHNYISLTLTNLFEYLTLGKYISTDFVASNILLSSINVYFLLMVTFGSMILKVLLETNIVGSVILLVFSYLLPLFVHAIIITSI